MKMYEVDVLVTGTRREIYHIVADSQEAAVKQAVEGLVHAFNENYEPQDHSRELYEVCEIHEGDEVPIGYAAEADL